MDLIKFLPILFSLLSKGGEIAGIIKLVMEALARVQGLLPQAQQAAAPLDVKWLQQKLTDLGFDPGPVDGDYGQRTKDAVKRYQENRHLEADGWCGPETLASMVGEK